MGPVRSYLVEKLEQKLREHIVVVWYDPERTFEQVFEAEELAGARKVRGDDGLLRLRHEVEPFVAHLQPGIGAQPVLAYVPDKPLPERRNLLLPLERLGTAYQATLAQVAQRAFRSTVPAEQVREWLDVPGITLEKLDELATGGGSVGALAAVYGEAGPYDVALRFLARPALDEDLDANLTGALRDLLARTYGIDVPEGLEPAELRDVFAQRLLVREFIDDLTEVPDRLAHLRPGEGAGRGQKAAVRELAEALRNDDRMVEVYRHWADEAQKAFALEADEWDPEQLGRRDTFGFEERLALKHVMELAAGGAWDEAEGWARERGRSFWARKDERRRAEWQVARTSLRLRKEAEDVRASLPASKVPANWVRWYVGESREDAPWRADRLARELASLHLTYMNEDGLRSLVELARERIEQVEQRVAERFLDVVADRPASWAELPQQVDVFAQRVAPLLDDGRKVVLVLADALRYEMGRSLAETLEDDGGVDMDWAVAALPTLTKIGMAALLPGAEEGLELRPGKKGVVAALGNTPLPTIVERRKWLEERYGARVLDLPLDECVQQALPTLTRRLETSDLILLRSQDIDQIGETDSVMHARSFMSHVEQQLHAAIRKLSRAGAQEFVVVADHGYLLRTDVGEAMTIPVPGGECLEVHRRCVLGRTLDDGQDYVRLRASDLGLGGGLDLAFPRGINIFSTPGGNRNYFHGGLSLQEVVVPVLRHTPAAAEGEAPGAAVSVELVQPRIANAFFPVRVEYRGEDLFAQAGERRLRVEVVKDGMVIGGAVPSSVGQESDRGEVALETGKPLVVQVGLTEPLEGKGTVELRAVDVKLGETLATRTVEYDLSF